MSTAPEPTAIDRAEAALRAFGDELSRDDAVLLLAMWQHRLSLTDREVLSVLARFGEPGPQVGG